LAWVSGVSVSNTSSDGTPTTLTTATNSAALAIGGDSLATLGGIAFKNAVFSGTTSVNTTVTTHRFVYGVAALSKPSLAQGEKKVKDRPDMQTATPTSTRLQIELSPEMLHQLEDLMRTTGLATKKELVNNALTLLTWAVREVEGGSLIVSLDEKERRYKEFLLPALTHAASRRRRV